MPRGRVNFENALQSRDLPYEKRFLTNERNIKSHNQRHAPKINRLKMLEDSTQRQDVTHSTLVFEREISAPVSDVFSAYVDVRVRAAWSVPSSDVIIYDSEDFLEEH